VAGIVLTDFPATTHARRKLRRRFSRDGLLIATQDLARLAASCKGTALEQMKALQSSRQRVVDEYVATEQYKVDFLQRLKGDLMQGFSYVHDYKSFISQVNQNINVIIEKKYAGASFEEKLQRADASEQAIYWLAKYMEEKLKTALFLVHPERITDASTFTHFEFYKMVDKYLRIYRNWGASKRIQVEKEGASYGSVEGNSEAVAIVAHTFIDNAFKYAPTGSKIAVSFDETATDIRFSVSSFGPEIRDDERETIFEMFKRGDAARRIDDDGMGFGLYLARFIARAMRTDISVDQSRSRRQGDTFWTTFSVVFARV
jgi:signal transduction histidine kinase